MAASLEQKLALVDKMTQMQKLVRDKREEAVQQALALQPVIKLVIQKTRQLQNDVNFYLYFQFTKLKNHNSYNLILKKYFFIFRLNLIFLRNIKIELFD